MDKDSVPEKSSGVSIVGRFLRRLSWRRDVGPVRAEAEISARELMQDEEQEQQRDSDTGRA